MAKKEANFPETLDILNVDRQPEQVVTSDSYDVIESAITKIEAELRRTTEKSAACILTIAESGVIKLTASGDWILTLPDITGVEMGLPFLVYKADDNNYRITIVPAEGQTIAGETSYTELNYKNSWVYLKSDIDGWDIIFKDKSLDMGEW